MLKAKLLCILHCPPPAHGAAKVGDFIVSSHKLKEEFECHFIPIRSSKTIGDIGKVNFRKLFLVFKLYIKVLWALLTFRPDRIYYTASIRGVALYRDLLVSTLWKSYKLFKKVDVFYHYHTKGVDKFVSLSKRNLKLTLFFLKDTNLILLSPLLENDFAKVQSYKQIFFLPNGIEDSFKGADFNAFIKQKFQIVKRLDILYLAHMIREKGYDEVLELARLTKGENIHYHFAGGWQDSKDEDFFLNFINKHKLQENVTYHGFVSGVEKQALFRKAHLLVYPSKNDAFPLTLLESLSYGVPVIASNEGSISFILNEQCGIVLHDMDKLVKSVETAKKNLVNVETAKCCRKRFLAHFTLQQFEENLVELFKGTLSV